MKYKLETKAVRMFTNHIEISNLKILFQNIGKQQKDSLLFSSFGIFQHPNKYYRRSLLNNGEGVFFIILCLRNYEIYVQTLVS